MRSLYESILDRLEESILGSNNAGISSVIIDNIKHIVETYYNNTASSEDELLLDRIWKENDLEIPGMKWYFTRDEGIQYGPEKGLLVPIISIDMHMQDNKIYVKIRSRKLIDYRIDSINSSSPEYWAKLAKQETKKMTDTFLKRYDKKLSKVLNMKPIDGKNDYFISIYELN